MASPRPPITAIRFPGHFSEHTESVAFLFTRTPEFTPHPFRRPLLVAVAVLAPLVALRFANSVEAAAIPAAILFPPNP